jgi:hypothetical protein
MARFFALGRVLVQCLYFPCTFIGFLTCSTKVPRAALSWRLTPLRSRHLAHRAARWKHCLAGMMIDACPTAIRTLAPDFILAA